MNYDNIILIHFLTTKLCTTYSYVHSQSQNNIKIHVNFANHNSNQNMWQEVTSYIPCRFFAKEISKAVSNSKNESIHKKSNNEWGSGLVQNELKGKTEQNDLH
jgi:hypothetical protein